MRNFLMLFAVTTAFATTARAEQAREATVNDRLQALEQRVQQLGTADEGITAEVRAAQGLDERIRQLQTQVDQLSQAGTPVMEQMEAQVRRMEVLEAQVRAAEEARAAAETGTRTVDYLPAKGVVIHPNDNFELQLRGWIWSRFEFNSFDEGDVPGNVNTLGFSIPESRVRFTGLFGRRLQVVIEPSLVVAALRTTPSGAYELSARPGLQDGYVELSLHPAVSLRFGQMLVPFDWEINTAPPVLPMVGYSPVTTFYNHGRGLGAMLTGTVGEGLFHYRAGVFNSSTIAASGADVPGRGNPNNEYFVMTAALVLFQVLGTPMPGWGWSDLEKSRTPNLGIGAGFTYDYEPATFVPDMGDPTVTAPYNRSVYQVTGNIHLRWYGISLAAVAHWRGLSGEDRPYIDADGGDAVLPFVNAYGYFIHLGYMAIANRLEVVARYSSFDPNTDVDANIRHDVTGGLTLFLVGHQMKFTLLYRYQIAQQGVGAEDDVTHGIQLQATGWF
jgi:hypothetical protein